MKRLLIIDDDEGTLLLVSRYLNKSGYKVFTAKNGDEALELLQREELFDLIIVDVVMPVMDGIEFCRIIKNNISYDHIPVLMLTAMSDITDKYVGFDAGADDYLTKPFEPLELLLRVQALLKRNTFHPAVLEKEQKESKVVNDFIKINRENFSVSIGEKEIYLTSVEFEILSYLYVSLNKPISVEEILQKVMDYPPRTGNPETIRTHIKNIRSKIEEDPSEPKLITTVPKRGYMFNKKM